MARSEKKRQQKAMKQRLKEKAKKKKASQSRFSSPTSPRSIIRQARRYPVDECLITGNWQDSGLASILIVRRQSDSLVLFGVFLVDLHCLGVKNAFCNANMAETKFTSEFRAEFASRNGAVSCSHELAHQVIYGALDYAAGIGFQPHKDFSLARHVLEPRDTIPANDEVEFGVDGKPQFVAGPEDNVSHIMAHLEKRLGEDGFHFIVPVEPSEF